MDKLAHYTCFRTPSPPVIDGKLDEACWQEVPWSEPLVDIVTGKPAWFNTRVALLWDDECLYFGYEIQETDVWATLTERDSKIYNDNDVELFIGGQDAYYEFEINALNTIYEVFWIWEDALRPGGRYHGAEWDPKARKVMRLGESLQHDNARGDPVGYLDWDFLGLKHAVHVDGKLNSRKGTDKGWSVELAFPWKGLAALADGKSLPPKDGDVWRIDCARFQQVNQKGEKQNPPVGWTWNRHGEYNCHMPEKFTVVDFSEKTVKQK